jgi:hypothetical protein
MMIKVGAKVGGRKSGITEGEMTMLNWGGSGMSKGGVVVVGGHNLIKPASHQRFGNKQKSAADYR